MSDDLIRRSDAIKAIEPYLDYIEIIPLCGAKPYVREAVYGIRSKIKSIPIIEPKRGKWKGGDVLTNCSICGEAWDLKYLGGQEMWYTGELPNFCPNCGADMREREGE